MIHNELEKLKNLRAIELSETEKAQLRAHIARTITTTPFNGSVPIYQRALQHGLHIMLSTFIFMIFVAGSVSVVADNALPGDPLYAFKIHVNEEIRTALLNSPEKKVAYQTDRIDTRLNEIKTLAATKTLTKAKQATVQSALDDHLTTLSQELNTTEPTEALKVTNTLEENLKAQKASVAESISTTTTDTQKNDVLQVYDNALQKVSDQEVKIISKEVDSLAADINNTQDPTATTTTLDVTATSTDSGTETTISTTT